jgi:hypothetical protein
VKRRYNQAGTLGRKWLEWWYVLRFDVLPELRRVRNPLRLWKRYREQSRGMEYWTDVRDWLGGWPMEFAGIRETITFCRDELQLELVNLRTGESNTEYLFRPVGGCPRWDAVLASRHAFPLPGPYERGDGKAFASPVIPEIGPGDTATQRISSRWVLLEDGMPLGMGHTLPVDVAAGGMGRYAHWEDRFIFSASDDSDPNSNGRAYAYSRW